MRARTRCASGTHPRWLAPLLALGVTVFAITGTAAVAVGAKSSSSAAALTPQGANTPGEDVAPAAVSPGPVGPIHHADLLIVSPSSLARPLQRAIARQPGVRATVTFSLARTFSQGEPLVTAAVDPQTFRAFSARTTAGIKPIWTRVAGGEVVLRSGLRNSLALGGDRVELGTRSGTQIAHVVAYADLVQGSDIGAIVNASWGKQLGMPVANAMIVSIAPGSPTTLMRTLRRTVGHHGTVQMLADTASGATIAVLAGGSVADVAGSFTYTANPDGSVNPDPRWIERYVRSEKVPILGEVRCNKAMLPQLRAALKEVVSSGLASAIKRSEYGGCYVPRFIASDRTRGLSMHAWGLAIDLNVPGNPRGTVGTIDRRVVAIFERWGFAWGGRWRYTDPMHFELARLVSARR